MSRFTSELPPSAQRLLVACPASGSGTRAVHRWILEMANHLRYYVHPEIAAKLILDNLSRQPKERELEEAIAKAYTLAPMGDLFQPAPNWPAPNLILMQVTLGWRFDPREPSLTKLLKTSDVSPSGPTGIIRALFPGEEILLCVGLRADHAVVVRAHKLTNLDRFQFIVPSPCAAASVYDQKGKAHIRCLANVPARWYIVLDFDLKSPEMVPLLETWALAGCTLQDAMAAFIEAIAENAPPESLRLVVFSGNRSLQAWFDCRGADEPTLARWFSDACALGVDPAGWVKCQYFRMPGGYRSETGKAQTILYWHPATQNPMQNANS